MELIPDKNMGLREREGFEEPRLQKIRTISQLES
jgi:hypothetical protein